MTDRRADGTSGVERARSRAAVRDVYDTIATHFSKTRHHPWPETRSFIADADETTLGLDLGCGNGRHTALLTEVTDRTVGVDLSRGLLTEARTRGDQAASWVQGVASVLPLAESSVSLAVYIATLHHLPDRETRRRSLSELGRVLAPHGRALVSVWSTAHDRFDAAAGAAEGFDTTIDWTLPDGRTVPRFYHIYAPAEFEADLTTSSLTVHRSFRSSGNCYAEVGGSAERPDRT